MKSFRNEFSKVFGHYHLHFENQSEKKKINPNWIFPPLKFLSLFRWQDAREVKGKEKEGLICWLNLWEWPQKTPIFTWPGTQV